MKLLRSTPTFIKGMLIAGMLGSCQNGDDTALVPQAPTDVSDRVARTTQAAGLLIKDGATSLSYLSNQGSSILAKEIHATTYSEFIYAPQLITEKGYKYGNPSTEYKYTLDASGRCVQLVTNWETYIFEYNADGQLAGWYNKNKQKERRTFTYATDFNGWKKSLSMIRFYDEAGTKTKEVMFNYGTTEALPDKCPLNPDALPPGVRKYLPKLRNLKNNIVNINNQEK